MRWPARIYIGELEPNHNNKFSGAFDMKTGIREPAVLGGMVLMAAAAMAQNYPDPRVKGGEPVMGDGGHITIAPNPI